MEHLAASTAASGSARGVGSYQAGGMTFDAWESTAATDAAWDDFLESTPLGHFQQSTSWARVKAAEGWRCVRVTLRQGGRIQAGFQLLYKRKKFLVLGYISKGPTILGLAENPKLGEWICDQVQRVVREYRISVVISQAPDFDQGTTAGLQLVGFTELGLAAIISATLCVPVGSREPEWRSKVKKTASYEARRASKSGVTIREGTEADLPIFFELMCQTCRRQNTSPNPASLEALRHLWQGFRDRDQIHLLMAELGGQPLAASLCLRFGPRVTLWKKGWNSAHPELNPNVLLTLKGIEWTERAGCDLHDFVATDLGIARSLLANQPLTEEQRASRHYFFLRFGGTPFVLPPSLIYFRNPLLRFGYPWLRPWIARLERWKINRARRERAIAVPKPGAQPQSGRED